MKLKGITLALVAAFGITALPSYAERPWGKDVGGRDPETVWMKIKDSPEVASIRDILSKHTTWERNNILKDGNYVADKAVIHVTQQPSWFEVHAENPGTLATPLADAKWLFLWNYADVDASLGMHKTGDKVAKGSVVVNEGEGQMRFPIYVGPGGKFHEVRLVSYKGKTLLYVMDPNSDKYLEEWILK